MSQRGEYQGLDTTQPGEAKLVKTEPAREAVAPARESHLTSGVFIGSVAVGLVAAAALAWWGTRAWRNRGTGLDRAFRAAARGMGLDRAARVEIRRLALREGVAAVALILSPKTLEKVRGAGTKCSGDAGNKEAGRAG